MYVYSFYSCLLCFQLSETFMYQCLQRMKCDKIGAKCDKIGAKCDKIGAKCDKIGVIGDILY